MAEPAGAAAFVYVGCTDSNEIRVLKLDLHDGTLVPVEAVTIPGIRTTYGSTPLAVGPDKRILFAASRNDPKVAASFAIDPATGRLRHIANGPLAASLAFIAADRTGRFLIGASYPEHKVTVNPIGPDGVVQPASQVIEVEPNAHAVLIDATNRFVFVPSLGGHVVRQFRFDAATGKLSPNDPPTVGVHAGAGPRHIVFHPRLPLVYLLDELDATICLFDYDARTGRLTHRQTWDVLPSARPEKIWAADIHLTPDGKFLYATERGSSSIAAFRVDPANGAISPIGITPTETQPRGFAIDPTGRFLLAVGQLSNRMTSYEIDPATGTLRRLKQLPMGRDPNWVEIVEFN